jgi:hypothetical protein
MGCYPFIKFDRLMSLITELLLDEQLLQDIATPKSESPA